MAVHDQDDLPIYSIPVADAEIQPALPFLTCESHQVGIRDEDSVKFQFRSM